MIVKIQLSIAGTEGRKVLIYDRDQKHVYEGPADEPMLKLMGNRLKAFHFAKLVRGGGPKGGDLFDIYQRVKDRDW